MPRRRTVSQKTADNRAYRQVDTPTVKLAASHNGYAKPSYGQSHRQLGLHTVSETVRHAVKETETDSRSETADE